MVLLLNILALANLASIGFANQHGIDYVLHEQRVALGHFSKTDVLDKSFVLPMRVGLTQTNLDKGYDLVMEVSHPHSKKYGQYYKPEEVYDLFAPSKESISAVQDWLEKSGIDDVSLSTNKQWLQFDLSVGEAEKLLQTSYFQYKDSSSGKLYIGCEEYHVPEALSPHIDYITPGVKTLGLRGHAPTKTNKRHGSRSDPVKPTSSPVKVNINEVDKTNCHKGITPQCISDMYDIPQGTSSQPGNALGIFEDGGGYLDTRDLNGFFTLFNTKIPNGTFPIIHAIDGAKNHNNYLDAGDETCGDFDIAYPIVYPQNIVYFLTDDDYYQKYGTYHGFFNTFLDGIDGSYCNYTAFGETGDSPIDPKYPDPHKGGYKGQLQCGVFEPTNVISFSYAFAETGGQVPHSYQQRQCNEYMKLALQGVSLVFASGDEGVGTLGTFGPNGRERPDCLGKDDTVFSPYFPATCPYVTAVGATKLSPASSTEEVAWPSSGGGFSNVYARPDFQKSAVETYFKSPAGSTYPYYTGSTYGSGRYNRTGRAIPDVSALGYKMYIYFEGDPAKYEGTSFATPLFAAVLTRINEERLKAGKPPVGFVNPVLYANPQAFNDITRGHNPNCNSSGFNAGKGWDPVTGLGTPDYPALLDVFMKL